MSNEQKEKLKALAALGRTLDKKYGSGALLRLGNRVGKPVPVIPTGLAALDHHVLGIGGLPKARIIEVFGPESAGKTTLALQAIAQVQKADGTAAMIDAEHAFNPTWAHKNHVDVDNLFINQPDDAEQGLQILEDLVMSNSVDLVVLDSIASLVSKVELNGDVGDAHVGIVARLMGQTLRKITGRMNKGETKTCVIMINQLRDKIGGYGNPEVTPGGKATKFYAAVRFDVRRREWIGKQDQDPIGLKQKIKAVKNKCAAPFRETMADIYFGTDFHEPGYDMAGSAIDLAFERSLVYKEGSGTTYFFNKEKIGIGEAATKTAIRGNPALLQSVQDAISKTINATKVEA